VQIILRCGNSAVELEIADTGIGIAADFLPYVFDRFRQGDDKGSKLQGGLGIGLAIAQHLVQLHGGTLAATSPGINQGAVFTVRLPVMASMP
jgi:signal transduction histidine kinase